MSAGPQSYHPGVYMPGRPRPASSPQPGQSAYTFKIKVSPGGQAQRPPSSPPVTEAEPILNIVDQGAHNAAPAPILPISALPGTITSQFQPMPRRSSSGSDDYAYTQGKNFLFWFVHQSLIFQYSYHFISVIIYNNVIILKISPVMGLYKQHNFCCSYCLDSVVAAAPSAL